MSVKVLLQDGLHRTLALSTNDAVLVFRHSHSTAGSVSQDDLSAITASGNLSKSTAPPQCMVEFGPRESLDLSEYRTVGSGHGTLGLITLNNDVFICVVTGSTQVANVRPGETVQKIHAVEFRTVFPLFQSSCICTNSYRLFESTGLRQYVLWKRAKSVSGIQFFDGRR